MGRTAGHRRRSTFFRMSRARMKLEPGERLLLAARPHPAALLPALLRALGVVLAAAIVHRPAGAVVGARPGAHRARPARARLRRPHGPALRARRLAVGPLALRAHDPARVRGRSARRRAARLGDDAARRRSTPPASSTASRGRLFGYATLTLGDGPRGRDVRFVSDAERVAEAILDANPHGGRTWTQIEGPAVSEQPAPRSRLA